MKTTLILLCCAARSGPGLAQTTTLREFRIDAGHSIVAFSIPFLGHAVQGRFDDVQGTIVYAPTSNGPGASAISVAIAANSISTGSKFRDEHLRSEDFFDAQKFPAIIFQSAGISRRGGKLQMTGTLTMHGVTRAVSFPFTEDGKPVDDPHGSQLVHYTAALRIARADYSIMGGGKHNNWFDATRSATMGDSVDISLEVSGWRTDYARSQKLAPTLNRIISEGPGFAIAQLDAAIAKNPANISGLEGEVNQLAEALLAANNSAEAIVLLKYNVTHFPKSATAQAALARAYEISGDVTAARTATNAALALDPAQTRSLELQRRLGRQ